MGGFDFKVLEGEEAKKFMKKVKDLCFKESGRDKKELNAIWYSLETSLDLTFLEDKNEVWVAISW